jgi:hypothetical protein
VSPEVTNQNPDLDPDDMEMLKAYIAQQHRLGPMPVHVLIEGDVEQTPHIFVRMDLVTAHNWLGRARFIEYLTW